MNATQAVREQYKMKLSCQITLEHIQARFASPATPADIQKAVQAFKDGFKEWEASE